MAAGRILKLKMTFIHNVNIIGGRYGNPAVLKTRLEPMKLEENMGITAKFIAFGEVADINGRDCVFYIRDFGKNVMLTFDANQIQ